MKRDLDDYYDLLIILGRVSLLIETFYYNFSDEQVDKINMYSNTVLFHITERSERSIILSELENMLRYVDRELKEMNL